MNRCPVCGALVALDSDGTYEYHTVWARRYPIAYGCPASFRKPAEIPFTRESLLAVGSM